ncbi:hypothetical protein IQ268_04035 [Oculatella sp. LEGE 06141]|uniref:hypothetical protein n=1 Tax=Oculatella sp. LEGE 06141 TaxID=1828648 RepID=UPI00187EC8B0|nr:hypothetical protein [Oculatella sp. LEGE 06141]MBE9177749.1 hypothetical protein [Oculatella sp. LEGE 06141]
MTQPNLLELARQGDPQAIATLMNRSLQPRGMVATVARQGDRLQVALAADQVPNRQVLTTFVRNGINNLRPQFVRTVDIVAHQTGATEPSWMEALEIAPFTDGVGSSDVAVSPPTAPLEAEPTPETIIQDNTYPDYQASDRTIDEDEINSLETLIEQPPEPSLSSPSLPSEPSAEAIAPASEWDDFDLEAPIPSGERPAEPLPNLTDELSAPYSAESVVEGDRDDWNASSEPPVTEPPVTEPPDIEQTLEPDPLEAELTTPTDAAWSPDDTSAVGVPPESESVHSLTAESPVEEPAGAIDLEQPTLLDDYRTFSAIEPNPAAGSPEAEVVPPPVEAWSDSGGDAADVPVGHAAREFVVDEPNELDSDPVSVEFFDLDDSSNHYRDDSDYSLSAEYENEPLSGNHLEGGVISTASAPDGLNNDVERTDSLDPTVEEPVVEPVSTRSERKRFPFGLLLALLVLGGWIAVLIGSALWMELINPRPIEPIPEDSPEAIAPPVEQSPVPVAAANAPDTSTPNVPPSEALDVAAERATNATTLAQAAQSVDDWTLVASQWQQAIALLETVPEASPEYGTAQQRLTAYRGNLSTAEQRVNQAPTVATAAPTTTITVSSDISCRGAAATAESQPVELTNVQFSQGSEGSEEAYIIGCVTNHTNQTIEALNVSYNGASAENPELLTERIDRINFSTLNPRQTVPFRSNFTIPAEATSVTLDALYWTPPNASQPEEIQASVVLNRDS